MVEMSQEAKEMLLRNGADLKEVIDNSSVVTKFYSIYDKVRKEYMQFFPAKSYEEAQRIVTDSINGGRDNMLIRHSGDYRLDYVFSMDISNGMIISNELEFVADISALIPQPVPAQGVNLPPFVEQSN